MSKRRVNISFEELEQITLMLKWLGYRDTGREKFSIIESAYDSGIGHCIDIEVPTVINGIGGKFTTSITDETSW